MHFAIAAYIVAAYCFTASTSFTEELARSAQWLVTVGCCEAGPVVPELARDDWSPNNPKGKLIEQVRAIRDAVKARVEDFLRRHGWQRGSM